MLADIVTIDWGQVRVKRALSGLVAMLLAVVFAVAVGDIVLSAVMATLFVTAAGGAGAMAERLPTMVRFSLAGAVLGGLAYWSADTALAVAIVLGVATYVGTIAGAFGTRQARAGLFLTLWALMALLLGTADTEPWQVSLAFAVGGAIALGVTALRLRAVGGDALAEPEDGESAARGASSPRAVRLRDAAASRLGRFALARTVAVVVAVLLGFWWFASFPMWVAITVIVVLQPSTKQSMSVAVQRTLGTAVGVGVAVVVAQVFPRGDTAAVIAFLASGLLMLAFMNANYTLFAAFLTTMLVFGQRLAQADAFEAGWERLLATALGALISLVVVVALDAPTSNVGGSEADSTSARPS